MTIGAFLRRSIAVFAFAAQSSLGASSEPLPDRNLTLEDSVRLAVNNSQTLLASREDVNIAMQRVRESEALFFPKLDLNANVSKFRVESGRPLLLQPGLGPTLIDESPRENFYSARANIYQPVYEGGRLRNTWRQARVAYERARSISESLEVQVNAGAKQAFYDLLLAQDRKRQLEALVNRLQPLANEVGGSLTERLRLEEELGTIRSLAAEAFLNAEQKQLAFLRTLNLELNTQVLLKGALETKPVQLDLQKLLAWSTQYRSELRQTEYQQEMDALGISLSLAERTPTVGFGASYERTGHDIELETANWAGTLNVNLPISISDLFFGWAKVRERRAQYRQATLRHSETADQIQLQVRQAYSKYSFWQKELAAREATYRRIERMAKPALGESANVLQRTMGERLVVEARLRFEDAIHGHLSAIAELERAVGHSISGDM
jgi:outer membrane protein TolC